MNHFVPEFDMDVDYSIPSSSGHHRQEDEILELLWQNGQVVVQSQNPRLHRKPSPSPPKFLHPPPPSQLVAPPPECDSNTPLFMQEDELNSWLEYPSFDRDLADLLYIPPGQPPSSSAALRPPPPPPPPPLPLPPVSQPQHHRQTQTLPAPPRPKAPATDVNFQQVSRTTTARFPDTGPSTSSRNNELRESTVVDSSDTPAIRQKPKNPLAARNAVEIADRGTRCREIQAASTAGGASLSMSREIDTYDLTQTSSPGGSGAGASLSLSATATADLMTLQPADDRKRKGREPFDEVNAEYQSEDVEIESYEPKKQSRGSANKKSRAAEVHNLSERRRRDRINEKMKVLQELIPRSSKTDKASMLDEAIDYLKSLQMQVQMMSMGVGMVPVMFPGVQQYMGMGMGMGMGMEMGMTRPMMPFPGVLPGSALPTPGAPSHLNPRFPLQTFPTPGDASVNPGHNMGMIPSLADAYQQCMSMQQMPVPIPQNQPTRQPSVSKQSAHRGGDVHENGPTG